MAVEVLGMPESIEITSTHAMVGDAARELSLSGQNPEQEPMMQQLGVEHIVIFGVGVAVAGLIAFIKLQRPWQRK
jgi:hypothetical protein